MQDKYATPRLWLDKLILDDAQFIMELVNTPGWIKFIGDRKIATLDDACAYIRKLMDNPNAQYWVVRQKTGNSTVGVVTLVMRDYLEHPDIGFAFLPAYMGQGYAAEAARTILYDSATSHEYILAITIKENQSSIKLLQKLGLRFRNEIIQNNEPLHIYAVQGDKVQIDRLVQAFFGLFTNAGDKEPNLDAVTSMCIADAVIIKQAGLESTVYNVASFTAPRRILLTNGTLTDFEEWETSEETTITGNIAQRHSVYEKRGVLEGAPFSTTGNKLFHFIKTAEGWRISALLWEDDV